jgi:endonuclease/exonuclease/phosphatase family metal-dependent hydrolase
LIRARFLALAVPALLPALAAAQVRIATYNVEADIDGFTTPRPGLDTVLQSIGSEPRNGFARPLDILTLQETTSNVTTVAPIVTSLNNVYGAGTYQMSPYQGTQAGTTAFGNGPNAMVYNTHTLQLIASVGIFTPSSSGPPRQEIRYQFRPVGYDSSADFYVYVGHYKSASDTTSEDRRNIEAQLVRANAATLPAGSRILYTGDMNLFKGSSEPAWITLTTTGSGTLANNAGIDPINLGNGSWNGSNAAFVAGYTDSTTSLRFRDDVQMNTAPTMDGHGFSYIAGSYHAFSNNGNIALGGQSPNSSVRSASDHYPVVADYRLPAKMAVSVDPVPGQVITGANVPVNVTVTNAAPVLAAIGADGLNYSVTSSGSLTGSGSGTALLALSAGNQHSLAINTSTPGTASGTVSVTSSSQEVANGTFSQLVTTQVLDHAHPDLNVATIDFGIRGRTLGGASSSFPDLQHRRLRSHRGAGPGLHHRFG